MRQIRNGVFETNSSSTHSICLDTGVSMRTIRETLQNRTRLVFRLDSFGWEVNHLILPAEKADYLYASILDLYERDEVTQATVFITDTLAKYGIEAVFEEPEWEEYNGRWITFDAHVDHAGAHDHEEFVQLMLHSESSLMKYLFSSGSFVITANDNMGRDFMDIIKIDVPYEHKEFFKGN
jgi:hypothetical protein